MIFFHLSLERSSNSLNVIGICLFNFMPFLVCTNSKYIQLQLASAYFITSNFFGDIFDRTVSTSPPSIKDPSTT